MLQLRALSPDGRCRVIVRAQPDVSVDQLILDLGGTLGPALPLIESRAAEVPDSALAVLSNSLLVRRVAFDRETFGTSQRTSATVGATWVRESTGYDGAGIGVAVVDSGVTSWHDDLGDGAGGQRVVRFFDFVSHQPNPYDDYGHGTHVAGIIAGNGADSAGARTGIAPGAHLVVLKTLDAGGGGRISDLIAALDFAVAQRRVFNIRVVNVSSGAAVYESYHSDLLAAATRRVVEQGIVVVAAAGNDGRDARGGPQYGAIAAPGNAPWVLTVGASSHMGTPDRSDDTMAAFSSRGPTYIDYAAKPDLVAPGVGIESLSDPNSYFYTARSAYLLDGTASTSYRPYLSLSGTSMAAPVVSGTAALMLQANPALTPNAVKAILQYTAQAYPGYNALTQGAGFLNARGAVELARVFRDPTATLTTRDGWTRSIIWGNQRIASDTLAPDADAWRLDRVWGTGGTDWSSSQSENVVWGPQCGGADCESAVWASSDGDTVVWGSTGTMGDTVVWGSNGADGDTVVWGSSCSDPACEPAASDR